MIRRRIADRLIGLARRIDPNCVVDVQTIRSAPLDVDGISMRARLAVRS